MKRFQNCQFILILCIISATVTAMVRASDALNPVSPVSQAATSKYAPGIMILKFKKDSPLAAAAAELFQQGKPFADLTGHSFLDELNQKYQVQKIIKREQDRRSIEAIKKKFPERSQRIPPGAQVPEWGNTYIFEFKNKTIDIPSVCAEYAKNSHVAYAQPDFRMKLYIREAEEPQENTNE